MEVLKQRRSLLASPARIQVPWIKVTFGDKVNGYTFGIFTKTTKAEKDKEGFYTSYNIQYPNYITGLSITKINGQVNQYTLSISYPVRQTDDPNFFEKVFSSISNTRKITFSYGDASMPTYIYKDEEAIITGITQNFSLGASVITYTVSAVSSASLTTSSNASFMGGYVKPSDEIKKLFQNPATGLAKTFTGMSAANLDLFIDGSDKKVNVPAKVNTSTLDLINYFVGYMVPQSATKEGTSKDIYILTLHDDTTYDRAYTDALIVNGREVVGPYFKVTRTSSVMEHSDAYEIDIGYNTRTIVTNFSIENNNNYSLLFDYQGKLNPEQYARRINNQGQWEDVYAPDVSSKNNKFLTDPKDTIWWTKVTQYPINVNITVMGLLRPAQLMTYIRLNVVFPGGNKHISSGLYIITKQIDTINEQGYRTQLSLTKISS